MLVDLRYPLLLIAGTAASAAVFSACGDDVQSEPPPTTITTTTDTGSTTTDTGSTTTDTLSTSSSTSSTTEGGSGPGICLLNNCSADVHCQACADGRNTCLLAEERCVACDPAEPTVGCSGDEVCSAYGLCIPDGLTCPLAPDGLPSVVCADDADCAACSPLNQVCTGSPPRCRACDVTDTQHCTANDVCDDGDCSPRCPAACSSNNDCMYCGGPGSEAHACYQHVCSQCNETTFPCANGLACVHGNCVAPCGIPPAGAGDCVNDEDCYWCGGAEAYDTWVCVKPGGAGPTDHGTCSPDSYGCADIGPVVTVLPEPWSAQTQLCSTHPDCSGISVPYNVGALVRDQIGGNELDLGFTSLTVCDTFVESELSRCAELSLHDDLLCGTCVPCQADADCEPVSLDPLVSGLFCSDPLATIAGAFLFDLLWGAGPEHDLHFFCESVGPGYGVCTPCINPTAACATSGGPAAACGHEVCEVGEALGVGCTSCTAAVCAVDGYCCTTAWDEACIDEVAERCTAGCGEGSRCSHSPCTEGEALAASCSSCAGELCATDPFCCNTEWDSVCVSEAVAVGSCQAECGGTACAHSECVVGGYLTATCSACAASVCGSDDFCCNPNYGWDEVCVGEAEADGSCSC